MSNITVEPYSEKSFVLRGNTKEHKDKIKELGGKWNSGLRGGVGWIMQKSKLEILKTSNLPLQFIEGTSTITLPSNKTTIFKCTGSETGPFYVIMDDERRKRFAKLLDDHDMEETGLLEGAKKMEVSNDVVEFIKGEGLDGLGRIRGTFKTHIRKCKCEGGVEEMAKELGLTEEDIKKCRKRKTTKPKLVAVVNEDD